MKIKFLIVWMVLGYSWALVGCETFSANIFPPKKSKMKKEAKVESPKTVAKQEKQSEEAAAVQTDTPKEKMKMAKAKMSPSQKTASSQKAISQASQKESQLAANAQKTPSEQVSTSTRKAAEKAEQLAVAPPVKKQAIVKAPPTKPTKGSIPELGMVYFEYDKSRIQGHFKVTLEKNLEWLKQNPHVKIQLEGHADERGTNEYNLALGVRRSKSILNYLISLGADPNQFSIVSFGEERPLNLNCRAENCFEKNRRVEFTRQ